MAKTTTYVDMRHKIRFLETVGATLNWNITEARDQMVDLLICEFSAGNISGMYSCVTRSYMSVVLEYETLDDGQRYVTIAMFTHLAATATGSSPTPPPQLITSPVPPCPAPRNTKPFAPDANDDYDRAMRGI